MTTETYIYLYCVTDLKPLFNEDIKNLCNNIRYTKLNDLYAIISDVPSIEFSEKNLNDNIANVEWLEKHVLIHENVINNIMISKESIVVVPFKFATIFYNEQTLTSFLTEYTEILKNNLNFLMNKEEWGVKIYYDKNTVENYILTNDPKIKEIDIEINSSTPGKAFFIKNKKQQLLNSVIDTNLTQYSKDCFSRLSKLSVQSKINKIQPKELTGKNLDMVLNCVFLVNLSNISEFVNILLELKNYYGDRGLIIEYSGPWPAYNFCNIKKEAN